MNAKCTTLFCITSLLLLTGCVRETNSDAVEEQLFAELKAAPIITKVSTEKDTLLTGQQGTKIFIPKEAFEDADGNPVEGTVDIILEEAYSFSDIIANKISTVADGQLLETAGMVHISALAGEQEVWLKAGKTMQVYFPKKAEDKGMELFYGVERADGVVEWQLAAEFEKLQFFQTEFDEEETLPQSANSGKQIWIYNEAFLEDGTLNVDENSLHFVNHKPAHALLDNLLYFTEEEKQEFISSEIRIDYILFDDGDLECVKVRRYPLNGFWYEELPLDREIQNRITKAINTFPYCKPFSREGKLLDMPGFIYIKFEPTEDSNLSDLYKNSGAEGLNSVEYHIFNITQLGWINCDYFIENDAPKIDVVIELPTGTGTANGNLIFERYNTVLAGEWRDGKIIFPNVPQNEAVKVVILKADQQHLEASITTEITSATPIQIDDFESFTLGKIRQQLTTLN